VEGGFLLGQRNEKKARARKRTKEKGKGKGKGKGKEFKCRKHSLVRRKRMVDG